MRDDGVLFSALRDLGLDGWRIRGKDGLAGWYYNCTSTIRDVQDFYEKFTNNYNPNTQPLLPSRNEAVK